MRLLRRAPKPPWVDERSCVEGRNEALSRISTPGFLERYVEAFVFIDVGQGLDIGTPTSISGTGVPQHTQEEAWEAYFKCFTVVVFETPGCKELFQGLLDAKAMVAKQFPDVSPSEHRNLAVNVWRGLRMAADGRDASRT